MLAALYSEFCLVHMQLLQVFQSQQYVSKSLYHWSLISPMSRNVLKYLLTIKFKCIIHVWMKENAEAVQSAKEYLQDYEANQSTVGHRMWFMKFLSDRGEDKYK